MASLVGFLFDRVRVRGLPIPLHRTFPEVNLRFYVRRPMPDGTSRRAVVFLRELVPRWAIATVARWVYNEPYLALPMSWERSLDSETGGHVAYRWRYRGAEFSVGATVAGPARPLVPGSEAEFITEHYWGYTRQRDGSTLEYQVEHPPWAVWDAVESEFRGPGASLYGTAFGELLAGPPQSAFVAAGSAVVVHAGQRMETPNPSRRGTSPRNPVVSPTNRSAGSP